ncbi:hypothetical protein H2200_004057 [Cladophialophora chaetospira]|uniref:Uncharacterized protein n=1 Tax=Cladophialophora chaetospira TaxID=386627 RepID=A0AA38XFD4_9EURO|nr:hypothetical protein H2200_004057 [Cladophialophora chaetospira]
MAVNTVWWMSNTSGLGALKPSSPHPTDPHKDWPWNQNTKGLPFSVLAEALKAPSAKCCVQEYIYQKEPISAALVSKWRTNRKATQTYQLLEILKAPADSSSTFYIVTDVSGEVIEALGHYLAITPRFFEFPPSILNTGNTVQLYSFFSLQLMERYSIGTRPTESRRSDATPYARFFAKDRPLPHEWHVTRVAIIFMTDTTKQKFRGLIQLDHTDEAIAKALETLMVRDEETLPGDTEAIAGQGQILTELVHIVNLTWNGFLGEAEAHLRYLESVTCIQEELSPTDQLKYTRELHQLSPLWAQVRRRLVAARDLAKQMIVHPYFISMNAQEAFEPYLKKCMNVIEEQIDRSAELTEETNNLISLIFIITTMQDTRATIAESRAANAFAASIRRITVLTFVYLPLTLAASIFGMNVQQVTNQAGQPQVWWYLIVAASLMAASSGAWCFWSNFAEFFAQWARRRLDAYRLKTIAP